MPIEENPLEIVPNQESEEKYKKLRDDLKQLRDEMSKHYESSDTIKKFSISDKDIESISTDYLDLFQEMKALEINKAEDYDNAVTKCHSVLDDIPSDFRVLITNIIAKKVSEFGIPAEEDKTAVA